MISCIKRWLSSITRIENYVNLSFESELSSTKLSIKCDIQQTTINTSTLENAYKLLVRNRLVVQHKDRSIKAHSLSDINLKIVTRIKLDQISCFDLIGAPFILTATNSCTLMWEQLNLNRKKYLGLVNYLNDRRECMLCNHYFDSNECYPSSFIIIPSFTHSNSFLRLIPTINRASWIPSPNGIKPMKNYSKHVHTSLLENIERKEAFEPWQI
ncbi:hypothetical protein ACOME3_008925 [Neoechinorhynchus agilis]